MTMVFFRSMDRVFTMTNHDTLSLRQDETLVGMMNRQITVLKTDGVASCVFMYLAPSLQEPNLFSLHKMLAPSTFASQIGRVQTSTEAEALAKTAHVIVVLYSKQECPVNHSEICWALEPRVEGDAKQSSEFQRMGLSDTVLEVFMNCCRYHRRRLVDVRGA